MVLRPRETEEEVLIAILQLLNGPEPQTPEEVDAYLRAEGYDPEKLAARGKAIAEKAMANSPLKGGGSVNDEQREILVAAMDLLRRARNCVETTIAREDGGAYVTCPHVRDGDLQRATGYASTVTRDLQGLRKALANSSLKRGQMLPQALRQPQTDEELHASIVEFVSDMARAIIKFLHGSLPDTQEETDALVQEWGKEIADEIMAEVRTDAK